MSFSSKNDAESSRNSIKNKVLDPKRAKFIQKSYGKFMESLRNFQDLSSRTHKVPRPYAPIWAPTRTGPQPGLGPNPARAGCSNDWLFLQEQRRSLKGTRKPDLYVSFNFLCYFFDFGINFKVFGLKTVFFELLHAKPRRII